MSEHEIESLSTQATLLSVVEDLERRVEAMTESLVAMRDAVRQIAIQVRDLDEPAAELESRLAQFTVVGPIEDAEPLTTGNGSSSWSPPVIVAPAAESADNVGMSVEPAADSVASDAEAHQDAATEEAAREEVRRAVEATRAQLSWSNLRVDAGFSTEPRNAPSEETVPAEQAAPDAEAVPGAMPPAVTASESEDVTAPPASDEEARRDELRLAVDKARSDMAAANESEPAVDAEEARREEVRLAVESARSDMAAANESEPAIDAEEARREEVRLAVERARVRMYASEEQPAVVEDDYEARREEVRRAVENHRGSGSWSDMKVDASGWGQFKPEPSGFSIGPDQAPPRPLEPIEAHEPAPTEIEVPAALDEEPLSEEETRREEVRRTVEAARAEMVRDEIPDRPAIAPIVFRPGAPPAKGSDFNGPPLIVIDDPLGRVELSQVFATLSRVDRSAQAALLNYSPHSVTIGLSMVSAVPDPDQLVLAAQAVFGRVCSVKLDGNRTSIEIGTRAVGSEK